MDGPGKRRKGFNFVKKLNDHSSRKDFEEDQVLKLFSKVIDRGKKEKRTLERKSATAEGPWAWGNLTSRLITTWSLGHGNGEYSKKGEL